MINVLNDLCNCTGNPTGTCSLAAIPTPSSGNYRNPKFIIISDYPGSQEVGQGASLVGVTGGYIRRVIFGIWYPEKAKELRTLYSFYRGTKGGTFTQSNKYKDYIDQVISSTDHLGYYTNAIKCKPGDNKVTAEYIQQCGRWLQSELNALPIVPILIAGNQALRAMKYLVPQLEAFNTSAIARNEVFTSTKGHKCICSANPYLYETFTHRDIWLDNGKLEQDYISNPPPLSARWFQIQDIILLKELVDGNTIK